jgi:transcriptional regulator with XRE-family HTH domain
MNRNTKSFGRLLRELRRDAALSQEELATAAGVDFTYISKVENDRVPPPSEETVLKLCRVLKAEPDALLAASRRVPQDLRELITSSRGALQFIRSAQSMALNEDEWEKMTRRLKRLRR